MPFGQVVIGPPGSGKTTYCHTLHEVLNGLGRKTVIVNLDPANERVPYPCAVNLADLIRLEDAMDEFGLGPNGGIMYCMEYLAANLDWLLEQLAVYQDAYLLFDLPGQVELYSHHSAVKQVLQALTKNKYQLVVMHLTDAHHCTDAGKYISVVLTALRSMLHLELPQVNVLSKIDLAEAYGRLAFKLDYYTDVQDLDQIVRDLDAHPTLARYAKLNRALCSLIDDYSLVAFVPLAVRDAVTVRAVIALADKAGGYMYGPVGGDPDPAATAVRAALAQYDVLDVHEEHIEGNRRDRVVDGGHGMDDADDEDFMDGGMHAMWARMQRDVVKVAAGEGRKKSKAEEEEAEEPRRAPDAPLDVRDVLERLA
ncbi:hypothetical protein GGF31_009016 [Allomyces arbusculus]|nr:hypothetical protein GGF31_009016 [Allomyces arbusculus]